MIESPHSGVHWQQRLRALLKSHTQRDIEDVLANSVEPALRELAEQIRAQKLQATLNESPGRRERRFLVALRKVPRNCPELI